MTRKAKRPNPSRNTVSRMRNLPSPTGGWVANREISSMKENEAVLMRNWFPHTDSAGIRKGHKQHATTPSAQPVETVMNYRSGTDSKLFAVTDGSIYDVTAGDALVADVSGLTNSRLNYTHFAVSGGTHLIWANGADPVQHYNGTAWATPTITGVSSSTLVYPFAYRQQLFFCQVGTATVYSLPADSVAGAVVVTELGGLLDLGGFILAGTTWTLDAGEGPDDYCVFLSSEGEVLIFQGTDPAQASTWSLKGRYRVGRPVGRRCIMRIGAEVSILCSDGIVQLTKILARDRTQRNETTLTWKIQSEFNQAYKDHGTNQGWQMFNYPESNMIIVNVPISAGSMSEQYVMNTLNGSWCQFTNMHAFNWCSHDADLFFGGLNGIVYQGDTTGSDNGSAIPADLVTSFTHWGYAGVKMAHLGRPVLTGETSVTPAIAVFADYKIRTANIPQSLEHPGDETAIWDVSQWDQARWPSNNGGVALNWGGLTDIGHRLAIGLSVAHVPEIPTDEFDLRINEFNCIYQPGNFL